MADKISDPNGLSMRDYSTIRGNLPKEVIHDGIKFPWMVLERALKASKNYDIRDDDIWVTSYPKAGNHWTCEIVNLILADGHKEYIDRSLHPVPMEFDYNQPENPIPDDYPAHKMVTQDQRCRDWPSPRMLRTHVPEHMMPNQIYEGKGKVIFVLRNPKDQAVSMWHFSRRMGLNPKHDEWNSFFEQYCTDRSHLDMWFGSWFSYNLTYWKEHRFDKNFLFLKYEDMKHDLRGAVVQIADFIGRRLSDEANALVCENGTADNMKRTFKSTDTSEGTTVGGTPIATFIRKATVGDWRNQFTVAQNDSFDKLYKDKMEGSGLHMDFVI